MIRLVRILGVSLMIVGVIVILTWLIKPLRQAWPVMIDGFQELPIPVQIGLVIAAIGFLILFSSIVWERVEDSKQETGLKDE